MDCLAFTSANMGCLMNTWFIDYQHLQAIFMLATWQLKCLIKDSQLKYKALWLIYIPDVYTYIPYIKSVLSESGTQMIIISGCVVSKHGNVINSDPGNVYYCISVYIVKSIINNKDRNWKIWLYCSYIY